MPLADGTLLICFLDDRSETGADHPRVLVWHADEPLEEVKVSDGARRLLAALATPDMELPEGLSPTARAARVRAALAAPLPQRSASELRALLLYSKTHEWRVRRQLADEFDAMGLGNHLVSEARGCVGLRAATSDIAALHALLSDGRLEAATTLLRGIASERPDALEFVAPLTWAPELRGAIEESLEEAIREWRSDDSADGEPQVFEAEVVDDSLPTPAEVPPAPAHNPGAAIERWGAQLVLPRTQRSRRRARVLARVVRRLAGPLLAVVLLSVGGLAMRPGPDEPEAEIPSSAAGPWPDGEESAIANLTRRLPFDNSTPATLGDILLFRQRVPVSTNRNVSRVLRMSPSFLRQASDEVSVSPTLSGPVNSSGIGPRAIGVGLADRLRPVPGTTRLLDVEGNVIRALPDPRDGLPLTVTDLRRGRVYFVETRSEVFRTAARGSFGNVGADCRGAKVRDPYHEYADGAVVDCALPVWNWGPRSLRSVQVRFARPRWDGPQDLVHQVVLPGSIVSSDAWPDSASVPGAIVNGDHWGRWDARYVASTARVLQPDGRIVSLPGNPLHEGVTLTDVPAVPDNEFSRMPKLQFKFRLVDRHRPPTR